MRPVLYDVSGLVIECDIALAGIRQALATAEPDVVVTDGGLRRVPQEIPEGELLQTASPRGRTLYSTVRIRDGRFLLRVHERAEFEISADTRLVRAFADPAGGQELLALLTSGSLVATVLALRGETVLHASAVAVEERAVAFVAHSGVGKSTLAALACTRGACFITDDLLRVQLDNGPYCLLGPTENRLRRDVTELAPGFEPNRSRTSVDGRFVWQPLPCAVGRSPLAAVVLPQPVPADHNLQLSLIPPGSAVFELTRRPRTIGWIDERVRAQTFVNLSRLAATVPVYRALVPWGPPFEPAVIDELLSLAALSTPQPAA